MSLDKVSDIFKKDININVGGYTTQDIATRFENTLNNLNEILSVTNNKNGKPIYSVWIKFQLGESEPILFDSQSNIYERNLIANLNMSKGQNGYANSFTLEIYYDAFKNGQETNQSTAEVLDEWVSDAMSYDFDSDTGDFLKGYIQYGYNLLDETDKQLYTPIYEFYITDASSEVNFNSGITHYVFQGTSIISSDINFIANIEKQEDKPLNIVKKVLEEYYGSKSNNFNYEIEISDKLLNEQRDITISKDATTANPLIYCKNILDEYFLNQAEFDSGEYTDDKLAKMKEGQKPRYTMFITENGNSYVIHINHVSKSSYSTDTVSIDYIFDWSNTNNNIVMSWRPEADLKIYLLQSAKYKRNSNKAKVDTESRFKTYFNIDINTFNERIGIKETETVNLKQELNEEYYDATLECIGIPADAPIGGIIRVKPVVLQSVSRTAGIYFIRSAEDVISTNGTYKTTLTLFRINILNKWNEYKNNNINNVIDPNIESKTVNSTNKTNENVVQKLDRSGSVSKTGRTYSTGNAASILNNLNNGQIVQPLN